MDFRALFVSLVLFAVASVASAGAAGTPLTEDEVEHWIRTEIEVVSLQMDYKANADQYEDVIAAFFAAKEELVTARGYPSNDAYDATSERIFEAVGAMEEQARLDAERAERAAGPGEAEKDAAALAEMEAMITEIETNAYLTAEQKQEMIAALKEAMGVTVEHDTGAMQDETNAMQQAVVDRSKPDWPAVRPWIDEINHLTDWAAGNRADPPVLD